MRRRDFLVLGAGLPLAACGAAATVEKVAPQVVSDLGVIANGVAAVLPTLSGIGGVGLGIASAVSGLVSDAKQAASAVSTALSTVAAQPFVSQVASDIGAAATALKGISLPTSVSSVLSAAEALLPVVKLAVGIASVVALAGPPSMSPDEARAILAAAVAGR